tara:strand:+ start:410 stop:604 length:195 start_codon:yes stop_codon:yes gene_type:complete
VIDWKPRFAGNYLTLLDGVRVLKNPKKNASGASRLDELVSVTSDGQTGTTEEGCGSRIRCTNSE